MPRKPARTDAQVERLAAKLQERWTTADGIMPWLRRRMSLLTRLHQRDGWSWSDIARVLNAAGITYESGRPWTGFLLARKVGQARSQVVGRKVKQAERAQPSLSNSIAKPASLPTRERNVRIQAAVDGESEGSPTFAPASLAHRPLPPSQPLGGSSGARAPVPARPRVDVDALIRRLQGCDTSSHNKG